MNARRMAFVLYLLALPFALLAAVVPAMRSSQLSRQEATDDHVV